MILRIIENRDFTLGIFIDFDILHHTSLLGKLSRHGIRGVSLSLLNSYLDNRMQCVYINNYFSLFQNMKCGVQQRSVLGSLLFNIYINDIVNFGNQTIFIIYANDATPISSPAHVNILITHAKTLMRKLFFVSKNNGIHINTSRLRIIFLGQLTSLSLLESH